MQEIRPHLCSTEKYLQSIFLKIAIPIPSFIFDKLLCKIDIYRLGKNHLKEEVQQRRLDKLCNISRNDSNSFRHPVTFLKLLNRTLDDEEFRELILELK